MAIPRSHHRILARLQPSVLGVLTILGSSAVAAETLAQGAPPAPPGPSVPPGWSFAPTTPPPPPAAGPLPFGAPQSAPLAAQDGGFDVGAPVGSVEEPMFGSPEPPSQPVNAEAERLATLAEQANFFGSTGLLRTAYAGSGAPGTFRVGFLTDWFATSGFLCNANTPCEPTAADDETSHVGGWFTVNATPFPFLEAYAGLRTYANSNSLGSPTLLQVLGDTTLGVKAFTPSRIGDMLTVGGDVRVLLMNGAGDVGVAGSGTGAEFNLLTTLDFRKLGGRGLGAPVRVHVNGGYRIDNSGNLVSGVEQLRAERNPALVGGLTRIPISRIERFGLGINRVDFLPLRFGIDAPMPWVQPYVEFSIDVPVNRQDYACHTRTIAEGDVCLALKDLADPQSGPPGFSAAPSRLTIGARSNPLDGAMRGLSGHVAFDIGTSATSTFIEEVAPQAPWTLYMGLSYAFDTREKPPVKEYVQVASAAPTPTPTEVAPVAPPAPIVEVIPPPPEYFVRGVVKDKSTGAFVADAIVTLTDREASEPPFATDASGRFMTRRLEPGTHAFGIRADGYNPGTCSATIVAAAPPVAAATGPSDPPASAPATPTAASTPPADGGGALGVAPDAPAPAAPDAAPPAIGASPSEASSAPPPSSPTPPTPGVPEAPLAPPPTPKLTGSFFTDISCELESLPRNGGVVGSVTASDRGSAPVAGAKIVVTSQSSGAKLEAQSGVDGMFKVLNVPIGEATVTVEASGYFGVTQPVSIRPREDAQAAITLTKRPAVSSVRLTSNQIQIMRQINFDSNSDRVAASSDSLLQEIAEVIRTNPNLSLIEIQGHTDNTGSASANRDLSQRRSDAVRTWLVERGGIEPARLVARGFGQDRPLVPNVTPINRARNRRVQFIILKR